MQHRDLRPGIRSKLIAIFVVIKVLPLLLLAWLAWMAAERLGLTVSENAALMAANMLETIRSFGEQSTQETTDALDDQARESLERLTTDTALAVADFLYARDADILQAAQVSPSRENYQRFLQFRTRISHHHGPWRLNAAGNAWEPDYDRPVAPEADVSEALAENTRRFSSRAAEWLGEARSLPLFHEMTFIDLEGQEQLKVNPTGLTSRELRDVSGKSGTYLGAESYWSQIQELGEGEIHVGEVIGAYVSSRLIGVYTPDRAAHAGIEFEPRKSAYAGAENPVGQRFRGLLRWVTPVFTEGRKMGYVTLALDHRHLRQFIARIAPGPDRYSDIQDARQGNYAFMWDHKSRSIVHPREYFIFGYDPETGHPATPWMSEDLYREWQASGLASHEFLAGVRPFRDPGPDKKPSLEQIRQGTLGIDCRYLNHSPQCAGWHQLTETGGSGSFLSFFSGVWKLNTAAAIPYFTGQYGASPRGFGFVTIGANTADFHRAAHNSATRLGEVLSTKRDEFEAEKNRLLAAVSGNLRRTSLELALSTLLMVVVVILIAVWMSGFLTRRVAFLSSGLERWRRGELSYRMPVKSGDEIGQLTESMNRMAGSVEDSFKHSEQARMQAEQASQMKSSLLTNVSHELRTPLNGILGFAELLEMEAENDDARDHARTINQSGQHLLSVVNDLLDLAKAEAGQIDVQQEPLDLAPVLAELVKMHQVAAQQKGLQLKLQNKASCMIYSDALRLRQILNNLLHNAIKFTDSGYVLVDYRVRGAHCEISVTDTGKGISPEAQDRVFEAFSQVEDFDRRHIEGTGMGLALVRQLSHLLGGDISLDSKLGQGSTFTVNIPLDGDSHD